MAEKADLAENEKRKETPALNDSARIFAEEAGPARSQEKQAKTETQSKSIAQTLPLLEFNDDEKAKITSHYQNKLLNNFNLIQNQTTSHDKEVPHEQTLRETELKRTQLKQEQKEGVWGPATQQTFSDFVHWLDEKALPESRKHLQQAGVNISTTSRRLTDTVDLSRSPHLPSPEEVYKIESVMGTMNRDTEALQSQLLETSYSKDKERIGKSVPQGWQLQPGQNEASHKIALREGIALHDKIYATALMAFSLNKMGEHFEIPDGISIEEKSGKLDVQIELPEKLSRMTFSSQVSKYEAWTNSITERLQKDHAAIQAVQNNPLLNFSISNQLESSGTNEGGEKIYRQALLDEDGRLLRIADPRNEDGLAEKSHKSLDMTAHRFTAWRTEATKTDSDVITQITVQAQNSRVGYDLLNENVGEPFLIQQKFKAGDPVVYNGRLIQAKDLPELESTDKLKMYASTATDIGWDLSMFVGGLGTLGKIKTGASTLADLAEKNLAKEGIERLHILPSGSGINLAAIHAATETLMGIGGFVGTNTWGEANAKWINSIRGAYFTSAIFGSAASAKFSRLMNGTEEFQASINSNAPSWLRTTSDVSNVAMQILTPLTIGSMIYESGKQIAKIGNDNYNNTALDPLVIEEASATGFSKDKASTLSTNPGVMSLSQQASTLQEILNNNQSESTRLNALVNAGQHTPVYILDRLYQQKISGEESRKNGQLSAKEIANSFGNTYDDVMDALANASKQDASYRVRAASALTHFTAMQLQQATDTTLRLGAQLEKISDFRSQLQDHPADESAAYSLDLDLLESKSVQELAEKQKERKQLVSELNQALVYIKDSASEHDSIEKAKEHIEKYLLSNTTEGSNTKDSTQTLINAAKSLALIETSAEMDSRTGQLLLEAMRNANAEQAIEILGSSSDRQNELFSQDEAATAHLLSLISNPDELARYPAARDLLTSIARLSKSSSDDFKAAMTNRIVSILQTRSNSMYLPALQISICQLAVKEDWTALQKAIAAIASDENIAADLRQAARESIQIKGGNPDSEIDLANEADRKTDLQRLKDLYPEISSYDSMVRNEFLKTNKLGLLNHDEFVKSAQRIAQDAMGRTAYFGFGNDASPEKLMAGLQTERESQFQHLLDIVKNAPLLADEKTSERLRVAKLILTEIATNNGFPIESTRSKYIIAVDHNGGQIAPIYFEETALARRVNKWEDDAASALAFSAGSIARDFVFDSYNLRSLLATKTSISAEVLELLFTRWNAMQLSSSPAAKSSAFYNDSLALAKSNFESRMQDTVNEINVLNKTQSSSTYQRIENSERLQKLQKEYLVFQQLASMGKLKISDEANYLRLN